MSQRDPGGTGGSPKPQTLTTAQLIALWVKAGGSLKSAPQAVARALAESGGRTTVTSDNPDGGTNVGIWQLDTKGVGAGRTVSALQDPLTNAQITVKATNNGTNWSEWADNWQNFVGQVGQEMLQWDAQAKAAPGGVIGYADSLLKDVEGIGSAVGHAVGGFAGQLLQLPSQVTDFLTSLEKPVQGLMWFVNPANWARIIAGLAGFLLLGAGLIALGMSA